MTDKTLAIWLRVLGWFAVAQAVTFEVKDGNSTCIKAEISANFSITYPVGNGTSMVVVPLPVSAMVANGSSCGVAENQTLLASFGEGHVLGLAFSRDQLLYQVANLTLRYNLSDSTTFPQSSVKDVVTLTTDASGISAQVNTTYRCQSSTSIHLGGLGVNITFSDVRMEAYMNSANFSTEETVCLADLHSTTASPTRLPPTRLPPTTPSPSPGAPEQGNYNVTNQNGTVCLLARMGLQFNVTYFSKSQNKTVQEILNLDPNRTSSSGSCESTTATLVLTGEDSTNLSLSLSFMLNSTTNKYHLSAVNMSAFWPDMTATFVVGNDTLNYLQGTLGRSYMCMSEQTLFVVNSLSINTFRLQVQPFGVKGDQFGSAEECRIDQDNMLIPIIVGAALAGLVLIVLIAYLIGRKRSHAGYQTI